MPRDTMQRIDYRKTSPEGLRAVAALERFVAGASIERGLIHLIKIRASQINGCAYCIDMHTKEARADGETEQRIYALSVWREAPFYSARERAALEWTEALTLVSQHGVPDDLFARTRAAISEPEIVDLTYAVSAINTWNRLAIAFRPEVGSYQVKGAKAAAGE